MNNILLVQLDLAVSLKQRFLTVTTEISDRGMSLCNGRQIRINFEGGYTLLPLTGKNALHFYYYVTDYLGSIRAVCNGKTGEVLQSMEYSPSGLIFRRTNYGLQSKRFCGKEELTMHGYNMYDSGARFQYSLIPRFNTMDPLCEKYYDVSPYAYCNGDPVNLVDPDGRRYGDYITGEGVKIGDDGIDDHRLYVLKTTMISFDEESYKGAPVAGISQEEADRVVREGDITNKNNFMEIIGSQKVRQEVASKIGDDGTGGASEANNREYLMTFDRAFANEGPVYVRLSEPGDPSVKESTLGFSITGKPQIIYVHTHPSGVVKGGKWGQAPSAGDVSVGTNVPSYVIGMRTKTVYVYDKGGIKATLPLEIYKSYKVK